MWIPPSGSPAVGADVTMRGGPVRRRAGTPRLRVVARSVILAAVLACSIAACRREAPPEETGARADSLTSAVHRAEGGPELPSAAEAEDPATRVYGDSLRFDIDVPRAVAPGAGVPIELRLTNISSRPITLTLLGRETAFDVEIRDEAGALVWRRLEGRPVPTTPQRRELAPGETLTLRDTWTQRTNEGTPAAEGAYLVMASVPGPQPEPIRTRTRMLRITAP